MLTRLTFLGAILVSVASGAALWRTAPPPQEPASPDFATLTRDLEIMRRVLASEARAGDAEPSSWIYGDLGLDPFASSTFDAYYVPGAGALFLGRAGVALVGAPAEDAKDAKAPDLWDRAQAEVEGRGAFAGARGAVTFDPKAVEAVKDRVLRALGTYGPKVGQLGDSDRLIVILRSSAPTRRSAPGQPGSPAGDGLAGITTASGRFVLGGGAVAGDGRGVLSLSVTRADCAAVAEGKLDLDAFKKRAQVATYFQASDARGPRAPAASTR